jgi:hypothetical protein
LRPFAGGITYLFTRDERQPQQRKAIQIVVLRRLNGRDLPANDAALDNWYADAPSGAFTDIKRSSGVRCSTPSARSPYCFGLGVEGAGIGQAENTTGMRGIAIRSSELRAPVLYPGSKVDHL